MGRRGRKSQTPAEKKLRGNPGKRDFREGASASVAWSPVLGVPDPPSHLTATEKKRFRSLVERLSKVPNLLSTLDADLLAVYCIACTIFEACNSQIKKEGSVCIGPNGGMFQHPAVSIRKDAVNTMLAIGKLFATSPKSRQDIRPEVSEEEVDPFTEFANRQMQARVVG